MHSPAQILPQQAARHGDKTALITATRSLSYAELDRLSNAVANALLQRGLQAGQTVSLFSQNRWEWIVSYHGVLKAGGVVNPVNVMLTPRELAYVLQDCAAATVFVADNQARDVLEAIKRLDQAVAVISFGDDAPAGTTPFAQLLDAEATDPGRPLAAATEPCSIGYTSGTTGNPKGAVQSHQAVYLNCALTATMHGRNERDVVVTSLPAPHVYGNVVINGTFLAGGTVVLMERFQAAEALALIGRHRATLFEGVPAMYAMMVADPSLADTDLSSITRCTVGGQTMPIATLEAWEQASGAPLLDLWGMTEIAGLGLTHPYCATRLPGSAGVSLPGIEIRIADLEDVSKDAPTGERGELMVRGPIVMLGYHNNPQATAETIEPDGWLHTGDIAYMNETRHVFIVDRRKDMLITGGYNIYPAEIEHVLIGHPDVTLVAVGPVPDPVKGELACAYIVRAAGSSTDAQAFIDYAHQHLAAYKVPRLVRFVESLPMTSSGKIMRRKLIELTEIGT